MFSTSVDILFYKVCEIKVSMSKRFSVRQNIDRDKHVFAVQNNRSQVLIGQSVYGPTTAPYALSTDLLDVFGSANIIFGN